MPSTALGMLVVSRVEAAREIDSLMGLRRSRSEPQLQCFLKVCSVPNPPELKISRSISSFSFAISGSIAPTSIRSSLYNHGDVSCSESLEEGKRKDGIVSPVSQDETISMNGGANWVQKICEIRSRWKNSQANDEGDDAAMAKWEDCECEVGYDEDEEKGKGEWNREAFGRLLSKVSWPETKVFSKLAFLCNMSYVIPEIKVDELRCHMGLRLVTSSLEKKQEAGIKANLDVLSTGGASSPSKGRCRSPRSSSIAYNIAASAASYIQNRANKLINPGGRSATGGCDDAMAGEEAYKDHGRTHRSKVATFLAAESVTAVVAAKEKARLEAARDLHALHSAPCEWFVCDEPSTSTRCFVFQGSDSLASWQANLFFEPTNFEETEALVHRGIYEAAKGIYQQLLPEIESHIFSLGQSARFRFIGHSLGGSLSLLLSLMLIARNAIPLSSLLPVVTFGSPAVFCHGKRALEALGLHASHVRAVMMHRDIVPRAFSCQYPSHVANVLKRVNKSFRSHPCLNADKLLYAPLGKQYIVQPDEKFSPPHPMLPPGAALYALAGDGSAALRTFLNTPHPLETLSNLTAYGSEGTILRDHHSGNYVIAMNALLREHSRVLVKRSRRERSNRWWLAVADPTPANGSPLVQKTWAQHHIQPANEVAAVV